MGRLLRPPVSDYTQVPWGIRLRQADEVRAAKAAVPRWRRWGEWVALAALIGIAVALLSGVVL
jgi:hypothetical protein